MDKTEYIRELIQKTGLSMKAFAKESDIPYTTLRSMLERGVENASVSNVIKVCKSLGVCVETLYEQCENPKVTKEETILLSNYNKLNDLGKKEANKRVEELAEMTRYTFTEPITIAAHDDDLTEDEINEMDRRIKEFKEKR